MKYFIVYIVCGLIAICVTWKWVQYLIGQTEKVRAPGVDPAPRVQKFPVMTGIIERIIYTTVIGFDVSGAGAFIGAWITIKAIGGWASWSKDQTVYGKSLFFSGLLGSAMFAVFGIFGGLIIHNKWP